MSKSIFKGLVILAATGLVLTVSAGIALTLMPAQGSSADTPLPPETQREIAMRQALSDMTMPEFALTRHDGTPIDQSFFEGRVTVLDFFFTRCPLACPGMTAAMRQVQNATTNSDIQLLSISVNGEHDTPEVITEYANTNGADLDRWAFATGPEPLVHDLVRGGLNLELARDEDFLIPTPDGGEMANINHPTRLVLVGPNRELLGLYSYTDADEIASLITSAMRAERSLD